jgi:hypothetical protein
MKAKLTPAGRRAIADATRARHARERAAKEAAAAPASVANGYSTPEQRDSALLEQLQTQLVGAKAHAESARHDVANITERIKLLRAQIAARPAGGLTMTAGGS